MTDKKRLYVSVFNEISALIKSGEFPVGSRLPTERELAARFKVSRPTVREAIIALEAKEQVSVKANSGVYVLGNNPVSDDFSREISAFELLEARVIFEGEAAALAARNITETELKQLHTVLKEMEGERKEDFSSSGADRKFHAIISQATHNKVITRQIDYLWDVQENFGHIHSAHQSVCRVDTEDRIASHVAIYDAIAEGNERQARRAMRHHFSALLEAMHAVSEREAVEETRRRVNKMRERFTIGETANV